MKKIYILMWAAAIVTGPAVAGGDSSDGHTHAAPAPVPAKVEMPRAVAATEEFEVVAVLDGGKLIFYVDGHADNAPITHAKLDIDGAVKGSAAETAPGTYVIDAPGISTTTAGRHSLTIAIETTDSADLLSATLEIATPTPQAGTAALGHGRDAIWVGAAALLLVGGMLIWVRNRKHGNQRKEV